MYPPNLTGAHLYPKDTILIVNIAGIHHNPKLYPEPYKFNPDNFTSEAISKRHRHSSIPFSAGPRNCIGTYVRKLCKFVFLDEIYYKYS